MEVGSLACLLLASNPRLVIDDVSTVSSMVASIPAPLTRGPGKHCWRGGGVNSKFVSKTLC